MTNLQKLIATFRQNQKYQIVVFITLLFVGWFYWFQLRPSNIRTNCYNLAMDKTNKIYERIKPIYDQNQLLKKQGRRDEAQAIWDNLSIEDKKIYKSIKADGGVDYEDDYKDYYENCLHEKGLK